MANQRAYDLSTSFSTWDDDAYLVVDKSGYARINKYKLSVLKGHLKVGDQQYTEENYVTNDETLTASIDALDMALKNVYDLVAAYTGLNVITVTLTSSEVANLGSAQTLIAAPTSANDGYMIVDMKVAINPDTTLEVGGQDLEIYFQDETKYLGLVRNALLENGSIKGKGVQIQEEYDIPKQKALYAKLSDSTNPSSGSASITFYIVYKEIALPVAAT